MQWSKEKGRTVLKRMRPWNLKQSHYIHMATVNGMSARISKKSIKDIGQKLIEYLHECKEN